jgi:hypothetical protein
MLGERASHDSRNRRMVETDSAAVQVVVSKDSKAAVAALRDGTLKA